MKKYLKLLTLGLITIISSLLLVACDMRQIFFNDETTEETYTEETYVVTFDSNDGRAAVTREIIQGNTTTNLMITRDGYTFQGWYLDGELFDFDTPITADIILQAKWVVDITEMCEYRLAADGKSYEMIRYNGTGLAEIVLPSEYNGLPVTAITAPYTMDEMMNMSAPNIAYFPFVNFENNGQGSYENQHPEITSIIIPDGYTSIGFGAFMSCDTLNSITIPDSVTSIGDVAFTGCTNLTSIAIPDSVTSIGFVAFAVCTNLTSVTIPDSVTSIGEQSFVNCTSLTSVTISSGVTSISDHAFKGCTSLTSIAIPDSVTSIGDDAFAYCESLTSITIPDSVTSIGSYAFGNCTSLTSIVIPDSVTSFEGSAFSGCTSLTSIVIPDSVTSIGDDAFYGWTSEQTIYFEAETGPEGWYYYGDAQVVWGYKKI